MDSKTKQQTVQMGTGKITVSEITMCGVFAALTFLLTRYIQVQIIPAKGGLVHLGNVPMFFAAAFFPKCSAAVMVILYFTGILMAVLMAMLMKQFVFKGEAVPFVMELPNYRLPGAKNVGQLLWEKAKDFLQRAFTVIFVATVIVWFLQSFNLHLNLVTDSKDSILALIAGIIAPVFAPLGLGDWRICTSLLCGVMAKESVVSTMQILFGTGIQAALSTAGAAAMLVFSLLYTPCIAAIASVKRELGGKWAVIMVVWQCLIAWVMAFVVHAVVMLF